MIPYACKVCGRLDQEGIIGHATTRCAPLGMVANAKKPVVANAAWVVYELVDPRTARAFYVGCSKNPPKRLQEHRSDGNSPAHKVVREIESLGLQVLLREASKHVLKSAAMAAEEALITKTHGALNVAKQVVARRRGGDRHKNKESRLEYARNLMRKRRAEAKAQA